MRVGLVPVRHRRGPRRGLLPEWLRLRHGQLHLERVHGHGHGAKGTPEQRVQDDDD